MKLFNIYFVIVILSIIGCKPPVEIREMAGENLGPVTFVPNIAVLRNQVDRTLSLSWDSEAAYFNENLFISLSVFYNDDEVLKINDAQTLKNTDFHQIKNINSHDIDLRIVETVRDFDKFVENTVLNENIGTVAAVQNLVPTVAKDTDLGPGIEASISFTWDNITEDSTKAPIIQDTATFNQYNATNDLLLSADILSNSSYTLQGTITDNDAYSFGLNASYSNASKTVRWIVEESTRVSARAINIISGVIVPTSANIVRQDNFYLAPTPTSSSTTIRLSWQYSMPTGTTGTPAAVEDIKVNLYEEGVAAPVWDAVFPSTGVIPGATESAIIPNSTTLSADKSYYFTVSSDSTSPLTSFVTKSLPSTLLDTSNSVGIVNGGNSYQYFDALPLVLPDYSDNGSTVAPASIKAGISNGFTFNYPLDVNVSEGRTEDIFTQSYTGSGNPVNAYSEYELVYSFGADHEHTLIYQKPTTWILSDFVVGDTPIFNNVTDEVSISVNANNDGTSTESLRLAVDGATSFTDNLALPKGVGAAASHKDISYSVFRSSRDPIDWSLQFYYDRPHYDTLLLHTEEIDNFVPEALEIDFRVANSSDTYSLERLGGANNNFRIVDTSSSTLINSINNSVGLQHLGLIPQITSAGAGITASNLASGTNSIASSTAFTVTKTHANSTTSTLVYHLDNAISIVGVHSPFLKYQDSYKFGGDSSSSVTDGVPDSYSDRLSLIAAGEKAAYALYATPVYATEYGFLSWGDLAERDGLGSTVEYFNENDSLSAIENINNSQDVKTIYAGKNWVSTIVVASAPFIGDIPQLSTSFLMSSGRQTETAFLSSLSYLGTPYPIAMSSGNAPSRFLATTDNNSYAIIENNPSSPGVFRGSSNEYNTLSLAHGTKIGGGLATTTYKKDVAVNLNTSAYITQSSTPADDGLLYIRGTDEKIFGSTGKKAFNSTGSGSSNNYVGIVGSNSYYAVLTDANQVLRIGDGLGMTSSAEWTAPAQISGLPAGMDIVDMAAGTDHLLVLDSNGVIYVVGVNDKGQLGTGSTINTSSFTSLSAFLGIKIIDIAAGHKFSMALDNAGNLYTWGDNSSGQLGMEKEQLEQSLTPIPFW